MNRLQPSFLLVTCLLFVLVPGSQAQRHTYRHPANSPLWWTLTDDLKPSQLRALEENVELARERYLLAVERGLAPPVEAEQLSRLRYFMKGSLFPDLIPLWDAFDAFAERFRWDVGWEREAPVLLAEYGLDESATSIVLLYASRHIEETDRLMAENGPAQQEFVRLMRGLAAKRGHKAAKEALAGKRLGVIAGNSGKSPIEMQRLHSAWLIDPAADSAARHLPQLKTALTADDWQNLRMFLFRVIAPQISAVDFEPAED